MPIDKSEIYLPKDDGIDHINVYSRGKTELGRILSNFSKTEIRKTYGTFSSVEGLYHYLKGMRSIKSRSLHLDDIPAEYRWAKPIFQTLFGCSGAAAKEAGNQLRTSLTGHGVEYFNVPDEDFTEEIIDGIVSKIENDPRLKAMVLANDLPYVHYYISNDGSDRAIYKKYFAWTANVVTEACNDVKGEDIY